MVSKIKENNPYKYVSLMREKGVVKGKVDVVVDYYYFNYKKMLMYFSGIY